MTRLLIFITAVSCLLTGCIAPPYYGRALIKSPEGELVCGVHGTPVKAHKGYRFTGLMHGSEAHEWAARRFPNIISVGFSHVLDKANQFTWRAIDYTCEECEKACARFEKLPKWYVRIVGRRAEERRSRELERAAKKAKRTGNPDDARLPDGDGWVTPAVSLHRQGQRPEPYQPGAAPQVQSDEIPQG